MRILVTALAASTLLAGTAIAGAQGTMNGVGHGTGMAKARCSPGDPNVLFNKTTKMYVMDSSAKPPQKGSGGAAAPSSMTGSMDSKSAMVSMCKSEALSMGAHMKSKSK